MKKFNLIVLGAIGACLTTPAMAEEVPMNEDHWEFRGTGEFVSHQGTPSIFLNHGLAILKDRKFENGVIEFDISFSEIRGFMGINFRVQDAANYENFYFRGHQSGNPDANQYTPAFNRLSGWQIYYGPQYSAPIEYNFDTWQHVKILVRGDAAEFYLDSDEPFLHIDDLLQENVSGGISISSFFTGTYFSNFKFTEDDTVEFKGKQVAFDPWPENLVESFEVAEEAVFASDFSPGKPLNSADLEGVTWQWLKVERNGIANLAKINGFRAEPTGETDEEGNPETKQAATTLVRLRVTSDKDQFKTLKFGYSDKATVFLNGWPVAGGDNTYMTRDYRYLGTVGLFDSLYLHLNEGQNEIIFAITEAFGGWALMAAFEDMEGISLPE